MKILVTSDLHLSDRIWRHYPIEGDSYHSWNQIVDLAINHSVDAIILAGDILDKQQNLSYPIQNLLAGIHRLQTAAISVYYTQGQHEYQQRPWMDADPDTHWLNHEDLVTPTGWRIVGCDYKDHDNFQSFLSSDRAKSADILVCHQVWKDFMGDIGKPQGEFADIPPNVKVLITGDYHEHICQKFADLIVLSPGSTHMRSISEPEEHSVFLLNLSDKSNKPKIKSIPLVTRRCLHVDTRSFPDFKALKKQVESFLGYASSYAAENKLPEDLKMPLIHLTHSVSEMDLMRQFETTFNFLGHLFFRQVTSKSEDSLNVIDFLDAQDRVNLIDCLDQFVDEKAQPLIHSLALSLLRANDDQEQALHRWIKEHSDSSSK